MDMTPDRWWPYPVAVFTIVILTRAFLPIEVLILVLVGLTALLAVGLMGMSKW